MATIREFIAEDIMKYYKINCLCFEGGYEDLIPCPYHDNEDKCEDWQCEEYLNLLLDKMIEEEYNDTRIIH